MALHNDDEHVEEDINILDVARKLWNFFPFGKDDKQNVTNDQKDNLDVVDALPTKPEPIKGENIDKGIDNGLGKIFFLLKYDVGRNILKVKILKASNLVGKDPRGTSDPYAVLQFAPPTRDFEYKTSVKRKTINPIWNHIFVFRNFQETDLDKYKIKITIFDWERYAAHEPLGETEYLLKKLKGQNNLIKEEEEKEKDEKGVTFCNELDNKLEAIEEKEDDGKSSVQTWVNNIEIHQLVSGEDRQQPLMPLEITREDERIIERSASMIIMDNVNDFDDDDVEEIEEEELLESDDNSEKMQNLEKPEDISELKKKLNTEAKASNSGLDEVDKQAEEENKNVIRRIRVTRNLAPLPNSRSTYGELLICLDYCVRTRRLVVTIVRARNMIDPSRRSLIPFCTLRQLFVGKEREETKSMHRSSYRYHTTSPVWNEQFHLKAPPVKLKQTAVEIEIFHSTKATEVNDELLGRIRLGLKAYPLQKAHWIDFLSNIGRPISQWHLIRV